MNTSVVTINTENIDVVISNAQGPQGPPGIGNPVVVYIDCGNSIVNDDIFYNAETSATQSWTFTIDAGASITTF